MITEVTNYVFVSYTCEVHATGETIIGDKLIQFDETPSLNDIKQNITNDLDGNASLSMVTCNIISLQFLSLQAYLQLSGKIR